MGRIFSLCIFYLITTIIVSGVESPVKDQGHCGSCWAFASTAVIESHVALKTGLLFDLSVEQMAMCAPNVDSCGGKVYFLNTRCSAYMKT